MASQLPDVEGIILEWATGSRPAGEGDMARVLRHLAQVGFHPSPNAPAGGRLAGQTWRGRVLRGSDRLPPAEVHYLRHVVVGREWPDGTSLESYLASLREMILDPDTGVLVSRLHRQHWQVTAVRASRALKGPAGYDWVAVEYRLELGRWVTAFQPRHGLAYFAADPERTEQRWLRPPRSLNASTPA